MKKFLTFLSVAAITAVSIPSCTKDKAPELITTDITDTISFSEKIGPLIHINCATSGCHDAETATSGYDLSSFQGISDNASMMLNAMRGQGAVQMPYNLPALPDSSIAQFEAWIVQGKLNN